MQANGRFSEAQRVEIDAALTRLDRLEMQKRRLEAEQIEVLAVAMRAATSAGSGDDLAYRALRLDVAALLRDSEYAVERLLSIAHASTHYPNAMTALAAGELSVKHVREIIEEGAPLHSGSPISDEARIAAYEGQAVAYAREEAPTRLRPYLKRLVAQSLALTLAERHQAAATRRHVRVVDGNDGMADLIAHLPAVDAYAIKDRITRIAQQLRNSDAGSQASLQAAGLAPTSASGTCPASRLQTRDEARADVFRDLLLTDGRGSADVGVGDDAEADADAGADVRAAVRRSGSLVRAHIQVIIPAALLAQGVASGADGDSTLVSGLSTLAAPAEVAELAGHGPIDPDTALRLAATADAWDRVITDRAGVILAIDRYRPTPAMRRLLQTRDEHCRAPGCRVPARRCDIDHTIDAARGGPTATTNLAHLCRGHHTLKHHTDWHVTQEPDGVMTWVSPTGRTYHDRPPSRVRFPRSSEPPLGSSSGAGPQDPEHACPVPEDPEPAHPGLPEAGRSSPAAAPRPRRAARCLPAHER